MPFRTEHQDCNLRQRSTNRPHCHLPTTDRRSASRCRAGLDDEASTIDRGADAGFRTYVFSYMAVYNHCCTVSIGHGYGRWLRYMSVERLLPNAVRGILK